MVIELKSINVKGSIVEYIIHCDSDARQYFLSENLIVEYPVNVEKVPQSVLCIPFLGNVLPIMWISDAQVYVNEIDKDFYDNLCFVKKGYEQMYPSFKFDGELVVSKVVDNASNASGSSAVFFSGGMDATATLLRHIDCAPDLITIWGADIKLDDNTGWENVKKHILVVANEFDLHSYFIRSNFRTFINYSVLDHFLDDIKGNWWHEFQHGIGIISHAAPLAYINKYSVLYIASSYTQGMEGLYTCASDPTIDDYVHYCGCQTAHDGFELRRQDKAKTIAEFKKNTGKKIALRVCYMESQGKNCCACEKCYRSALELVAEGENPNDYGFEWDKRAIRRCKRDMMNKINISWMNILCFYKPLQDTFVKNRNIIPNYDDYSWIEKIDFQHFNDFFLKKMRRRIGNIKRKILM